MRRRDQSLQAVLSEENSMHRYRGDEQDGGSHGAADRRQVEHPHRVVERLKALLKRQGEQKSGEQLNTGLNDAQLLQQARRVAVEPLCVGLVALRVVLVSPGTRLE